MDATNWWWSHFDSSIFDESAWNEWMIFSNKTTRTHYINVTTQHITTNEAHGKGEIYTYNIVQRNSKVLWMRWFLKCFLFVFFFVSFYKITILRRMTIRELVQNMHSSGLNSMFMLHRWYFFWITPFLMKRMQNA